MIYNIFFSIIIPTYNRSHLLAKTIRTVFQQKYSNFEVIIIDDGSEDNTCEVVKKMQDTRIRYYYQKNSERATARNHGVKRATGEYITFLDSDDILYENYLQEAARVITSDKFPPFVHTGYEIKNKTGKTISKVNQRQPNLNESLLYGNSLSCLGVFVQREILLTHPFNEDRALSGSEDYELWMRLACIYSFSYSSKITAALIHHDERSVLGFDNDKLIKRVMLLIDYVTEEKAFQDKFGSKQHIFIAHRYLYLSLHLIMGKEHLLGIKYWIHALLHDPGVLFHIKTLGIFKNILINFRDYLKNLFNYMLIMQIKPK